jgi:hypothetical protein
LCNPDWVDGFLDQLLRNFGDENRPVIVHPNENDRAHDYGKGLCIYCKMPNMALGYPSPYLRETYYETGILPLPSLLGQRGVPLRVLKGCMRSCRDPWVVGLRPWVYLIIIFTLVANFDHYTLRKRQNGIEVFDSKDPHIQRIDS